MPEVRRALERLADHGQDIWDTSLPFESPIRVTRDGRVLLWSEHRGGLEDVAGQHTLPGVLNVLAPFESEGQKGPDLVKPRPLLRIIPGRMAGEPHLLGSRLTSLAVFSLWEQGYTVPEIAAMYPTDDPEAVAEAIDLEDELAKAA